MSTTAHTHTAPPDPLSQPRAAFNGHHVNVRSYNNGNYNHSSEPDGGRELSGGAWQSEGDQEVHDAASQADYSSWNEDLKPMRLEPSSPRVNPFHLLSQPNSDSALPPLPPHLQRLVASADHSEDPPVAPFHVTKVTEEYVKVKTGPHVEVAQPKRMMNKVSQAFKRSDGDTIILSSIPNGHGEQNGKPELSSPALSATGPIMQGPPPSPPISEGEVEQDESESSHALSDHVFETSSVHSGPPLSPLTEVTEVTTITTPSLYTSSLTAEPSDLAASPIKTSSTSTPVKPPHLTVPTQRRVSSGSATSRTGSLAVVRANRLAQQRNTSSPVGSQDDGTRVVDVSDEGDMENKAGPSRPANLPPAQPRTQPLGTPVTPQPRVSRRNTNPNPPVGPAAFPPRSPLMHTQSTLSVSPSLRSRTMVPGLDGSALDSDILAHAEEIRRERLERKQKKASAADAVPEPTAETAEKKPEAKREETKVLVGNLIGEDHVNYVLMYNMLTGIRIGVSRCQAKIKRPLTDEDYTARHKFSFDVVGNELTPSARYDFKFKDYAPWIFRDLRDEHFHLDPADYLLSLTAKYILSELGSPGKSGSFFYFSRDYRFIIKTISHSEHKFLRSILKDYHEHVKANPHTLLSRFYGLHRVKLPRGRKIHFVIMNNLFPPHRDIHETYDLKGSAYGREYDEEKAKVNPKAVLKDKNWVNRNRTLELGPEKRALLTEQLRRDMEFLKKMKVMDYSLLVGIHNMERGNRDNLRENQLSVFHPEVMQSRRKPSANKGPSEASNVRKAIRRSDPKMLDAASQLPNEDSADRRHFLFYQDEGGLRATDEQNQSMDVIYYLGVIDICTPYNTAKKIEHFWKSMTEDRLMISCIDPNHYGQRFLNFMMSVMRGGDPALRPPGLRSENEQQEERPVGSDQDKIKNESSLPQNPLMPSPQPHSPIQGQFSQMPVAAEPEEIASSSPRTEPAHLRAEYS